MKAEIHEVGRRIDVPIGMKEALSWRIAAELIRRHPGVLNAIETHPGGGQYDCLTLVRNQKSSTSRSAGHLVCHLNRAGLGHLTPASWFEQESERLNWLDVLFADDFDADVISWLEAGGGLNESRPENVDRASAAAASLISSALWIGQSMGKQLTARNGFHDSSGSFGSGVMLEYFSALSMTPELDLHLDIDLDGQPAYRYWFILDRDRPGSSGVIVGVDLQRGLVWSKDHVAEPIVGLTAIGWQLAWTSAS